MSALYTFKRTKGGATHYVAATIPKTAVIDKFTDDPVKAATFKENDAKALFAALESDAKVYGRWAVLDAGGREVSVFTHATPEPKKPALADASVTKFGPVPASLPAVSRAAERFLADEPDHSPFRELADQFDSLEADGVETLGQLASHAAAEIKALRESLDELTAPPKDDDTAVIDTTTGPAK